MPLFGDEEMVNVNTPDGRTLTLPRSVVPSSLLPSQIVAPPIEAEQFTPAPIQEPATQSQLAPPSQLEPSLGALGSAEPAPVPDNAGVLSPVEVAPPMPSPGEQRAAAKQQAARDAYAKTTKGKYEAGVQEVGQAAQEQAAAGITAADKEAAGQMVQSEAYNERAQQISQDYDRLAKEQQGVQAEADKKLAYYEKTKDKIANTKIDREHDHPFLATLGVVLMAIGQGMYGKHDGALMGLKMMQDAIDRKVDGQMADLEKQKQLLGFTKDELTELKEKASSQLALRKVLMAGAAESAAQELLGMAARSNSEVRKAQAQEQAAKLRGDAAKWNVEATSHQMDFEQRDKHQAQQMYLQRRGQDITVRGQDLDYDLGLRRIAADNERALAEANAKGGVEMMKLTAEAQKENRMYGVRGADGKPLLNEKGQAQMKQAEDLEARAAQLESDTGTSGGVYTNGDPAVIENNKKNAAILRDRASALRGQAQTFGTVKLRNDTVATAAGKGYAAAQSMITTLDEIINLQSDRGLLGTSQGQAHLRTLYKLLAVKAKEAWQLGAWDRGSATLTKEAFGDDPSKWSAATMRGFVSELIGDNPANYKENMKVIANDLETSTKDLLLKNSDYDGKSPLFRRAAGVKDTPEDKAVQKLSQARTTQELTADEEARVARASKVTGFPAEALGGDRVPSSIRHPGLSVDQEGPYDELLQSYRKGNKAAGDALVAKIANGADDKSGLSLALLNNLQQDSPRDLYQKARQVLPEGSLAAKEIDRQEKLRIGVAQIPTALLADQVINSIDAKGEVVDTEGFREITQRKDKDPLAKKAFAEIVKRSGIRKGSPLGSVFREGQ